MTMQAEESNPDTTRNVNISRESDHPIEPKDPVVLINDKEYTRDNNGPEDHSENVEMRTARGSI